MTDLGVIFILRVFFRKKFGWVTFATNLFFYFLFITPLTTLAVYSRVNEDELCGFNSSDPDEVRLLNREFKQRFQQRTSTGSGLLTFLGTVFAQIFGQIGVVTVKKLSNTNLGASRQGDSSLYLFVLCLVILPFDIY